MFEYDLDALKKVEGVVALIKPTQIDMAYWRKTPFGLPFDNTVACLGGWTCLMNAFETDGLKLIATDPASEFGYVPAIRGNSGVILKGYEAMGFVLQRVKSNDSAKRYGRNIFAMNGGGEFDKYLPKPFDDKHMVTQRIAYARRVHLEDNEIPVLTAGGWP
jgi:hypothetical protein